MRCRAVCGLYDANMPKPKLSELELADHPVARTTDDLPEIEPGKPAGHARHDPLTWYDPQRQNLPIELEIGSGKGTFLVNYGPAHRDVNLLGIEYARAYWLHAADRAERLNLADQIRMLLADAKDYLKFHAPDGCFQAVHIYFPDPWPKKRHHKRRLIQRDTLEQLHRCTTADAHLHLVTDHADYFQWMVEHVEASSDLFLREDFVPPASAAPGETVGTNFERKYQPEQRTIHAMTLRKC